MLNTIYQYAVKAIANISSEQWKAVLHYVTDAVNRATEGVDKRAWVLDKLRNLGITGSRANFLVECSVQLLRRIGKIQ